MKFSSKVCEQLGCYVYMYIDPRTGQPFYVGKGVKNRCFAHEADAAESAKTQRIRALAKAGLKPRIDLLKYGLTAPEALLVEATAIDLLGRPPLLNAVRGHGSRHGSRADVRSIRALIDARPVNIIHPVMLINVSRLYRPLMSPQEVYEITRSAWRVGPQRAKATFALSVYRGTVREVFAVAGWHPAGSTLLHNSGAGHKKRNDGRWEFVGSVAPARVRGRYIDRSVQQYLPRGSQNPICYVNCR